MKLRSLSPAALGLLAASCALATAIPPEVQVTDVELRGVGLLDQTFEVGLCVMNPNRTELVFQRVTIAMEVAHAPLAEGASELPVRLPPLASTRVPFTIATTIRNLGLQVLGVVRSGELEYRLHGDVVLAGALPITVPFSRAGRLTLLTVGQQVLNDSGAPSRCSAVAAS